MTSDERPRTFDRRRFVQVMGAGAGLALAGPLASKAGPVTGTALRVGVIVPTGSSYSNMGQSLVDGLVMGFDEARTGAAPVNATLVECVVDRGFDRALSTAQGLLDDGADVVVAGVSALVAERLGELFVGRQSPLVVAGVGAHIVQPSAKNAFVLHNSLLYWQASFAGGEWAAANLGKQAFLASSFPDTGYDTIYAFRRGFESAGGTIVGDAVTHADPADAGLPELFRAVRNSGAGVLAALYSGAAAAQFLQAYAGSGLDAKLVTGSLAVEDYLLGATGGSAVGTTSCASWTATRRTKANRAFTESFKARTGRSADPFAALGYDTAALVTLGVRRAAKQSLGMRRLVTALAGVSLEGPRGTLEVDGDTNAVTGPLSMRRVKRGAAGLANYDVAAAPGVGRVPSALSPLANGSTSGYLNEYLCAC